ncbi:hypothetical protein ACJ73_08425 [Blastomyces percursus]|uniref:Uncharacterized protein n=1 Tax=Blastomyces percursus TaxID=1658174 RepID=A0A1J9PWG1_9EURO|nr:hypothetical protein ACJ73_08425 [Blastomyces percursus]
MTLDSAVVDISEAEVVSGLNYVAVSRVKTLPGLLFNESFDYSQFKGPPGYLMEMREAELQPPFLPPPSSAPPSPFIFMEPSQLSALSSSDEEDAALPPALPFSRPQSYFELPIRSISVHPSSDL